MSKRGEQGLNNGGSLHGEPVLFLESQGCTAGSHSKKRLETAAEPVPKTSLEKSSSPRCLLWSITANSVRKPPPTHTHS